jgi:putative transposase
VIAAEGLPVQLATRVLEVSESGYYEWRGRAPSARAVWHAWLAEQAQAVHVASRGIYGSRRVHAELTLGLGITVSHGAVEMLMRRAGIKGLPGRRCPRPRHQTPSAGDLVYRQFTRPLPHQLWVTDITEHPTREGKLYCALVLDACTRRVVGWSIDASQPSALVTSALDMAIRNRAAGPGVVIHSDHGVQFTSWVFTDRACASGLLPSMGSIGDCYVNAMIESFWGRVQTELLNRQRWRTRIELANALFEYLEIFHNRRRRHAALGMLTPIEYELRLSAAEPVA